MSTEKRNMKFTKEQALEKFPFLSKLEKKEIMELMVSIITMSLGQNTDLLDALMISVN